MARPMKYDDRMKLAREMARALGSLAEWARAPVLTESQDCRDENCHKCDGSDDGDGVCRCRCHDEPSSPIN
jgi:hypothetical protein